MRTLTIIGYFTGVIILLASIARWFVIYNDVSQALFGASIGILILGGTYVYQRLSDLTDDIKDVNKGIDGLNIWVRGVLEEVNKEIDGLNIWVRAEFDKLLDEKK